MVPAVAAALVVGCGCGPRLAGAGAPRDTTRQDTTRHDATREDMLRWMRAAHDMRQQALSWGDQAYGAVLVQGGRVIGLGPSRVVRNSDPAAHAEREAIRHALAEAGPALVRGAVLYSTSRPCGACEAAAAQAGVARMYFGADLHDAGAPVAR